MKTSDHRPFKGHLRSPFERELHEAIRASTSQFDRELLISICDFGVMATSNKLNLTEEDVVALAAKAVHRTQPVRDHGDLVSVQSCCVVYLGRTYEQQVVSRWIKHGRGGVKLVAECIDRAWLCREADFQEFIQKSGPGLDRRVVALKDYREEIVRALLAQPRQTMKSLGQQLGISGNLQSCVHRLGFSKRNGEWRRDHSEVGA